MRHLLTLAFLTASLAVPLSADPAVIENVEAQQSGSGWSFSVTLSHGDTGWDDYADGWRVVAPDGTVLGTRVLAHPHVNEQPFTRSLGRVTIPDGVTEVTIEARTLPDGWTSTPVTFRLPGS